MKVNDFSLADQRLNSVVGGRAKNGRSLRTEAARPMGGSAPPHRTQPTGQSHQPTGGLPDLYFTNARTSKFHDVTIPNFSLFIDRDGNIAYSTRVTLNVACNLELANYPMDSQTCGIRMVSYAYVASQVNVSWFKIGATRYNPEIGLPEFKIVQLTPESCDGSYMYAIMSGTFKYDKFSCLEAVIQLNRQIGYHVVQSFIPTGLIVMISWVSFWIDRRAVPARVILPVLGSFIAEAVFCDFLSLDDIESDLVRAENAACLLITHFENKPDIELTIKWQECESTDEIKAKSAELIIETLCKMRPYFDDEENKKIINELADTVIEKKTSEKPR
ncbi:hypothetical protein niasHT_010555 [Heterodera trifolii]|uniref:Uncharacterized protein n=1 Tax=Heterodera trifolii TaxID=157864 RepID=A0ABD2L285_9BILA